MPLAFSPTETLWLLTAGFQKVNENCFDKCISKLGASISSGEKTCVTTCMEKYMAAWNHVNAAYLRRIQEEVGHPSL